MQPETLKTVKAPETQKPSALNPQALDINLQSRLLKFHHDVLRVINNSRISTTLWSLILLLGGPKTKTVAAGPPLGWS